jgi:hypothetical protein
MDPNFTESIRERAYHLWSASGCPDGEADLHWFAAEREILQAATATVPKAVKAATPAKRTIAKKASHLLGRREAKPATATI